MGFRLLGPLEVVDGSSPLRISAGKQRALLAVLLLNANKTVSRDRIVDDLWGDDMPSSARKMVQIHVSQLRKALPGMRLRTRAPGYALEVAAASSISSNSNGSSQPAARLSPLATRPTRQTCSVGAVVVARACAGRVIEPFARHEAARLEELRVGALEARLEQTRCRSPGRRRRRAEDTRRRGSAPRAVPGDRCWRCTAPVARRKRSLPPGRSAERSSTRPGSPPPDPSQTSSAGSCTRRDARRRSCNGRPASVATRAPGSAPAARPPHSLRESGDLSIAYQVVGDGPIDLVPPRLRLPPRVRWEEPASRATCAAGRLLPPDPLRQARDRPLRPVRRDRLRWRSGWTTCGR